jgi:hypothetical protein
MRREGRKEVKMFKVGLKRRGSILALVVVSLVILLIIGTALLTLGWEARALAIRTEADIAARCAADAGLTKAIAVMNDSLAKKTFSAGNLPQKPDFGLPLQGSEPPATFRYTVTPLPAKNEFGLVSTGRCNAAQRTVWGRLRLRGVGEVGVLVRESMTLKAGTVVDGRDSRDPCNLNPDVLTQIGTSSTTAKITLNNNVYIDGDVLVGFGGDPNTQIIESGTPGPTVTGYKGTLDEKPEFPLITPPVLPDMDMIFAQGKTIQVGPAQSGRYNSIVLKNMPEPGKLEIVGGHVILYITGDINLGNGCEIVIKQIEGMPHASLDLYVSGNIKSDEGSGFNNQGLPPDLKLWGLAQDPLPPDAQQNWQLNAKSEYFGQIYAPEATVQMNAKGELWGAFTAYDFTMMNSGKLFYDGALRDVNPNDPGVRFVLKRWVEGPENLP